VTVLGIVWGAAAALAVSRLLSALLFGVGGRDPRVYAAVALLILVVARAGERPADAARNARQPARRHAHGKNG
jgi:hypothetical protein